MSKRIKIALSLIVLAIVSIFAGSALGFWREYQHLPHIAGHKIVFIGIYPNIIQGQNASLLRLSQEVTKHPQIDVFVIRRTGTVFAWDDIDWYETIYDRRRHTILDGNVWAGDTEDWGGVSDTMVSKVAASSKGFKEFSRRGCTDILP